MRIKAALIELSTFIWKRRRGEEEEEERGGEDEIEMEASWGEKELGKKGFRRKWKMDMILFHLIYVEF